MKDKNKMIQKSNERFNEINESIKKITGISTEGMLLPDPINDILKKARKNTEKCIIKAFKEKKFKDALQYLRTYRVFTKLLKREPLDIFDFNTEKIER